MSRYINALFSLLLLMGAVSCSDDFSWNGVEVGEDEYLIAFAPAPQTVVTIEGTRTPSESINELTLVIFKDDKLAVDPVTVKRTDTNFTDPGEDGTGSIKVNRSLVADGEWYLIANASTDIQTVIAANTSNGDRISKADFLTNMEYKTEQFSSSSPVMVAHKEEKVTLTTGAQTIAPIFMLQHLYAQISVEIGTGNIPFRLTEARLTKYVKAGDMSLNGNGKQPVWVKGDATDDYTTNWVKFDNAPATDRNSFTSAKDGEVYYGKPGAQLMQYSYPYTPAQTAAEGETSAAKDEIMMIVKGYYSKGDYESVESACYYAIPVPEVAANHHYKIKIVGASMGGYPTPSDAVDSPNGIIVVFEDTTEEIKNIITDGENVLAVQDTVRIKANETLKEFKIKVRSSSDTPSVTLTKKNEDEDYSWLTLNTSTSGASTEQSKLYNATFTGRAITSGTNLASERSVVYTVSLGNTSLSRDIVFLQESPDNILYQGSGSEPIKSIKLTIKRGTQTIVSDLDYLSFINPKVVSSPASTQCEGIQPEQNGGRVRNLGLHMPMPNGGVTYTYTIETKNGYKIDGATTKTYEYKDLTSAPDYKYEVKNDNIKITYGSTTYTLDLYHTGFFHNDGGTWYYYEVYQQGSADLYWLDRNLGAKASGMDVRSNSYGELSGVWPLTDGASFGSRKGSAVTCPAGWTLPTYGQLRSLTVSSGFAIQLRYDSNQEKYYAPSYQFTAIEDGQTKLIRNYFPANMAERNGTTIGESRAGYYRTSSPAGEANYYKTMQFSGMNVTSLNSFINDGDSNGVKMSVRCCAGSHNPETDGTKYTCKVRGYTHVYMYYQSSDGTKTSLNTWPGDQIAVASDLDRYHPFEITPTMDYDLTRLYVVFNKVEDGRITDSNVSTTDRNNRIGIKFKNKGSYTSEPTDDDERPGQKGHWVDDKQADLTNESFRLKGNFNNLGWGNPSSSYEFTSKGTQNGMGVYEITVNVTSVGEFVIAQKNTGWTSTGQYAEWKHTTKKMDGTVISTDVPYTLNYTTEYDYNWKFGETGTYKITLSWTGNGGSFVATKEGGGNTDLDNEIFRLKGNYNSLGWKDPSNNDVPQFTSKGNGVYELNLSVTSAGQFVIAQKNGNDWKEWKHNVQNSNGTNIVAGTTYTLYTNGNDYNWKFPETGTYKITLTWNGSGGSFVVTKESTPTPTEGYVLIGWPNDWDKNSRNLNYFYMHLKTNHDNHPFGVWAGHKEQYSVDGKYWVWLPASSFDPALTTNGLYEFVVSCGTNAGQCNDTSFQSPDVKEITDINSLNSGLKSNIGGTVSKCFVIESAIW